jgi:biopolymer transport protein ExbB
MPRFMSLGSMWLPTGLAAPLSPPCEGGVKGGDPCALEPEISHEDARLSDRAGSAPPNPPFARGGKQTLIRVLSPLALLLLALACGADAPPDAEPLLKQAERIGRVMFARYEATPPGDRVAWGGLGASALLGLGVMLERTSKLRRKRIIPGDFTARFLQRMQSGKLDRGKALDFCELNPSPAARVALAAVRRWGRPVADLERATALAHRVEADQLRKNVGTLRRIAALAPLLGLLGTLVAIGRTLAEGGNASSWGPALAHAIGPFTAGVALATLALVAYDAFAGKVEALSSALDRIGAETIDAIALALPNDPPRLRSTTISAPSSGMSLGAAATDDGPSSPSSSGRTPHQPRNEPRHPVPKSKARPPIEIDEDDDDVY